MSLLPNNTTNRTLAIAIALPLVVTAYAVWYWSQTHEALTNWYLANSPALYRSEEWAGQFFTIETKRQGNGWCMAGMVASVVAAYIVLAMPKIKVPTIVFQKTNLLALGGIALVGSGLSMAANFRTVYSSDEVFSALNFAAHPVFTALSHYPLPNNHPLFNSVNGLFFGWSGDLVRTGRLLSLVCYVGVLFLTWLFLKKWRMPSWMAVLTVVLLALQMPVWGFSSQARGYEMLLFFSCLSLFTFYKYVLENDRSMLPWHILANVAGMMTVPSYLYWWAGLQLASVVLQAMRIRVDSGYLTASLGAGCLCLVGYLPLLTFSGIGALNANRYVRGDDAGIGHFLAHFNQNHFFDVLFQEWFCLEGKAFGVGMVLVLLPACLWFSPGDKKRNRCLGMVHFSMLSAFLVMAVLMAKWPFSRNMIAHGYFALLSVVLVFASWSNTQKKQRVLSVLLVGCAAVFLTQNPKKLPHNLYYFDSAAYVDNMLQLQWHPPAGSSVYLDDDSFYWWYVLKSKYPRGQFSLDRNRPNFRSQDFCVLLQGSQPPFDTASYRMVGSTADHVVFEKKY